MTLVKIKLDVKDAAYISANPTKVLALNEPIYRNDGLVAYGDGVTPLSGLTFLPLFNSGGTWGSITGTLSDQTDLQAALDDKVSTLTGTTNRISIDNTDPANPIVNIDSSYDAAVTNAIAAAVSGKEDTANKQTDLTPSAINYPNVDAVNDGLATILPAQPIFSGQWRGSMFVGVYLNNVTSTAGKAYFTPYFTQKKQTVTGIRVYVNTGVAAQTIRLCLMTAGLTSTGVIGTLAMIEESGAISAATSNSFVQYNFITPIELTEQVYWMGYQASSASIGVRFYNTGLLTMFTDPNGNPYTIQSRTQAYGSFTVSPVGQVAIVGAGIGVLLELLVQ